MLVLSKGFLKSSAAAGNVSIWKILIRHHKNIFVDLSRAASKKNSFNGERNMRHVFILFSLVNELALTARKMYADEARSCGLVR